MWPKREHGCLNSRTTIQIVAQQLMRHGNRFGSGHAPREEADKSPFVELVLLE